MTKTPHSNTTDRLLAAYHTMLDRLNKALNQAEEQAGPTLESGLEKAKQAATDLEELSHEEAEKLGDYLRRDLQDAGNFLASSGEALKDWIRFDIDLIEDQFMEAFANMADHTRDELDKLEFQANQLGEWKTGEITGMGTLRCTGCGEELHFHEPGHIPPCPACHGTTFKRVSRQD
jgi:predicted RNA-binding Zn-ribbon protein involved in translation (DUF1610 family)